MEINQNQLEIFYNLHVANMCLNNFRLLHVQKNKKDA